MKTKSPLNLSEKRRFSYNVSARWAPPGSNRSEQRADHPVHPVFSVAYQERFDVLGGRQASVLGKLLAFGIAGGFIVIALWAFFVGGQVAA